MRPKRANSRNKAQDQRSWPKCGRILCTCCCVYLVEQRCNINSRFGAGTGTDTGTGTAAAADDDDDDDDDGGRGALQIWLRARPNLSRFLSGRN